MTAEIQGDFFPETFLAILTEIIPELQNLMQWNHCLSIMNKCNASKWSEETLLMDCVQLLWSYYWFKLLGMEWQQWSSSAILVKGNELEWSRNMQCAKSLRNYRNLCLIKKVELAIAVRIFDVDIPFPIYTDSVVPW